MRRLFGLVLTLALAASALAQQRIRDVIYWKHGGAAYTFDVFKPAHPNGGAVVWLVSGGWVSDHANISPDIANFFNGAGFTVFEVVHGAQPKFIIPEIFTQVQHAVRFIHANAQTWGVDPNRLAVSGASAGGHLSLMLGARGDDGDSTAKDPADRPSSRVAAVVEYFGPTDFLNWGKPNYTPFDMPLMAIFFPAFGVNPKTNTKEQMLDVAHKTSPIEYMTAKMPPTLIIHGDADPLVPPQQSKELDAKLTELGVDHKLIIVPGGDHGLKTMVPPAADVLKWLTAKIGSK
jgi:acetyl esterase/lipase